MSSARIGLIIAALIVFATVVSADYVTTTVWFNVPSDISFTVTIPGKEGVSSGATTAIEYNSSIPTNNKINCTVREGGGASQTDTIPCFNYTNTGNRDIIIKVNFSSSLPSGVTVKVGQNDSAWKESCGCGTDITACGDDDCAEVSTSEVTVANIVYGGYQEVWMWADYNNYAGGSSNSRILGHASSAT